MGDGSCFVSNQKENLFEDYRNTKVWAQTFRRNMIDY